MMEKEGFRRVDDRIFNFSDHEYYAVYCELEPVADAVRLETEPMVMNRPEDRLDHLGVLEKSAARGASNPHAPRVERRVN